METESSSVREDRKTTCLRHSAPHFISRVGESIKGVPAAGTHRSCIFWKDESFQFSETSSVSGRKCSRFRFCASKLRILLCFCEMCSESGNCLNVQLLETGALPAVTPEWPNGLALTGSLSQQCCSSNECSALQDLSEGPGLHPEASLCMLGTHTYTCACDLDWLRLG